MSQCSKFTREGPRSPHSWATTRLLRFRDTEDGVLTIFALFSFLLILMVAGIGIDLMRFERDRTRLQYTLDRAVLAAADLDQTLDPKAVVRDYFEKAELVDFLEDPVITPGIGYRIVSAKANATFPTQFMHMSGIDTLTAPASASAEESVGGVEISLVLDVSGSMNSYSRLSKLKVAAKEFVQQMDDNTVDGKLSISIVPYSSQVSVPDYLMKHMTTTGENRHANCINFSEADFNTVNLDPDISRPRTLNGSIWSHQNYDNRSSNQPITSWVDCRNRPERDILVMQSDTEKMKTYIGNLTASGNTSIDIGMKWGAGLVDNSTNKLIKRLITDENVADTFKDRPYTRDSGETLKVIVLMTDGQNTSQGEILPPYREGNSPVWWNSNAQVYSTYDSVRDEYFWHNNKSWNDHPYGNGQYTVTETTGQWICRDRRYYGCYDWDWVETTTTNTYDEPGTAVNLSFPELWDYTTVQWHKNLQAQRIGSYKAQDLWFNKVGKGYGGTEKDTRSLAICGAAKDAGNIVYTIGFEAPPAGLKILKKCASSDSHFYDVEGLEIEDAFTSIASSIRKLRLTQ